MLSSLKSAKTDLRKAVQGSLRLLSEEEIAIQSSKIHEALFSLPEYQRASDLSVYLSMPTGEAFTRSIVLRSIGQGKTVFVPYLYRNPLDEEPRTLMDMVTLHSREDYDTLPPDKWGIPTPPLDTISKRVRCLDNHDGTRNAKVDQEEANGLDLIVMPGVAFDQKCRRVGHGKGFYDFFLTRYHERIANRKKPPFLVGLALQQQLLPNDQEVPVTSTDWPLDALVVGDGSVRRPSQSSS